MTFRLFGMLTAVLFVAALLFEWVRQETLAAAIGFLMVKFLLVSLVLHSLAGHRSEAATTLCVQVAASLALHRLLGRYRRPIAAAVTDSAGDPARNPGPGAGTRAAAGARVRRAR